MEAKDRLKELRKSLGLNQTDFAAKIGIEQTRYSTYERGQTPVPNFLIKSVSGEYGVSEEWLRGETDEMKPILPDEEALADEVAQILGADVSEEKRRAALWILRALDGMPEEYHKAIADFAETVAGIETKKENGE